MTYILKEKNGKLSLNYLFYPFLSGALMVYVKTELQLERANAPVDLNLFAVR